MPFRTRWVVFCSTHHTKKCQSMKDNYFKEKRPTKRLCLQQLSFLIISELAQRVRWRPRQYCCLLIWVISVDTLPQMINQFVLDVVISYSVCVCQLPFVDNYHLNRPDIGLLPRKTCCLCLMQLCPNNYGGISETICPLRKVTMFSLALVSLLVQLYAIVALSEFFSFLCLLFCVFRIEK